MSNDDLKLHPVTEARARLGNIGHSKFYELVSAGDIKLIKIGRRSYVRSDEITRFINAASAAPQVGNV